MLGGGAGHGADFRGESARAISGGVSESRLHHLDGHFIAKPEPAGAIDVAHPAQPEINT